MKFVKQLPNRMKWPKNLHIYQSFLKAYFARKCIVFFWKKLLKWQEFRLLRRSDLRQWLKFSCMKFCRIHVWIIHDMIYTQWLCMIFDHIHSYHGMNLAIIELWSLINEAFYTSCHRKTEQITDHFWKGRGFQYCAGLFIIFINCYNMNIVQFILWHSITRTRLIDQWSWIYEAWNHLWHKSSWSVMMEG